MAPEQRQIGNGPGPINEHAAYLREACHQLQDVEKGRLDQIPWKIVQQFVSCTVALAGKVQQQPALREILHHVQNTAKCTENIQRDVSIIRNSTGLDTT
ncbi:predicted protein [Uncinocarpus reesii 1704]|uniref:Uncharacterized protein n=1 Tax=Uncinocarpus reesii (strain UAMH 1704) TaxID=336963 RepID=C4K0B4_UNCRE|nr:uncharacterized protein UREG_07928 [Uncinocarpus reesii 1704]EEP83063.1 predicted protein [Uncinocarpus reesii 1704]